MASHTQIVGNAESGRIADAYPQPAARSRSTTSHVINHGSIIGFAKRYSIPEVPTVWIHP